MEEFKWAEETNCAITVCDLEGKVVYMNKLSRATFCKDGGSMVGESMMPCHSERSKAIIGDLLKTGGVNAYTITKNGVRKMIYQTAWKEEGIVKGLVEISMVIPSDMPHYDRDKQ